MDVSVYLKQVSENKCIIFPKYLIFPKENPILPNCPGLKP